MVEIKLIQWLVFTFKIERIMRFGPKICFRPFQNFKKKNHYFELIVPSVSHDSILGRQGSSLGIGNPCTRVSRISEKSFQQGKDRSFSLKDQVLKEYSHEISLPMLF